MVLYFRQFFWCSLFVWVFVILFKSASVNSYLFIHISCIVFILYSESFIILHYSLSTKTLKKTVVRNMGKWNRIKSEVMSTSNFLLPSWSYSDFMRCLSSKARWAHDVFRLTTTVSPDVRCWRDFRRPTCAGQRLNTDDVRQRFFHQFVPLI